MLSRTINWFKIITLSAGCLLCFYGKTQQLNGFEYEIKGISSSVNEGAKIQLRGKAWGKPLKDSVIIKNGAFIFKGKIDEPRLLVLILLRGNANINSPGRDELHAYIDKSKITINIKDSLRKAKITGGIEHTNYTKYSALLNSLKKNIEDAQALNKTYESKSDSLRPDSIKHKLAELSMAIDKKLFEFIEKNPASFVSLNALNYGVDGSHNPLAYENKFKLLKENIRNSTFGTEVLNRMKSIINRVTLNSIPDFKMPDTSGNIISIKKFQGKYLIIDFWASWCAPCRAQNGSLKEIYAEFRNKGLEILAVSMDRNRKDWVEAIKQDNTTWIHISETNGFENSMARFLGLDAIPYNLVINPEGKIVGREMPIRDIKTLLADLIK